MNAINIFKQKSAFITSLLLVFAFALIINSCKDDEPVGEPYFNIEGSPTGLSSPANGITQSYVVRSNRPWQIVPQQETDWVKIFPDEGEDDGIFKFTVEENASFDVRTASFAFVVDGKEQPVLFRIEQEGNVPYIIVDKAEEGVTIPSAGGEVTIDVNSNVSWDYSVGDVNWLTAHSKTSTQVKLTALTNTGSKRSFTLSFSSPDFPELLTQIEVTQSPGSVILEEDFNWLDYGNPVFYTTTGERRYDQWTEEEKNRGWSSSVNTVDGSGNTPLMYSRVGFVKLGKTAYGGDLISPPLTGITGTQNVKVTFKAIPYKTKAGTMDDNILAVSVIGQGTVSQEQFIIDNWPAYPSDDATHTDYCINMWSEPEATRTFTITGATAETQIKFLGWDYNLVGVGAGKNRIFLDDIKVEIID